MANEIAVYDVTTEVTCLGVFPETDKSVVDAYKMMAQERAKGMIMWTVYLRGKTHKAWEDKVI
jgi:hypothetical protein